MFWMRYAGFFLRSRRQKNNRDIHLIAGQPWGYGSNAGIQELKDKLTGLEDLLEGQGARQEALLDEIERSIREATKADTEKPFWFI